MTSSNNPPNPAAVAGSATAPLATDIPERAQTHQFAFTGGASTYFGTAILAFLVTVCTIGIYGFWVAPRIQRWRWEHTSWAQQVAGQ